MKQRTLQWNVVKDEGGQALTEFVIVIPIILLFFFAMLQYFAVVQASQLGNYAAYVAARSYAVHAAVDGDSSAQDMAKKAAAMALAPIARLVPGEPFAGTLSLPPGMPGFLSDASGLIQGYSTAYYIRLSNIGGGSINITTNGDPTQVNVTINYPEPVFIPGLSELWGIVGGGSDIRQDLSQLQAGLQGVQSANLRFPYINVQSKCSMGYEDWGNKDGKPYDNYRPRHPDDVSSDAATDSTTQGKVDQLTDDGNNLKQAAKKECQDCCSWHDARQKLNSAARALQAAKQSGDKSAIGAAKTNYDLAKAADDKAQKISQKAQSDRQADEQQYQADQNDLGSSVGNVDFGNSGDGGCDPDQGCPNCN